MDKRNTENTLSVTEKTAVSNLVFFTGDEITYSSDGVFAVSVAGETVMPEAKGRVKLQAGKKIIFEPGTCITPGEGEYFAATIAEEQKEIEKKEEQIALLKFTYKFSKTFKRRKLNGISNKDHDKESRIYCSSEIYGIVDNQQPRIAGIKSFSYNFSVDFTTLKNNILQTFSSFMPETIMVLRL